MEIWEITDRENYDCIIRVNTVSVCFSSINQRLQLVKKFINDNFPTSLARVVVPSVDYRCCDFRVRMDRWAGPRHDRVEPAVSVVLVLHLSDGTVRLHQSVLPFDDVSVALFRLFFDVSGVIVFHSVLEAVLGIGLEPNKVIPFAPLPLDRSHHGLRFGQSLRSVLHRVGPPSPPPPAPPDKPATSSENYQRETLATATLFILLPCTADSREKSKRIYRGRGGPPLAR
jgi:hypothetical protein